MIYGVHIYCIENSVIIEEDMRIENMPVYALDVLILHWEWKAHEQGCCGKSFNGSVQRVLHTNRERERLNSIWIGEKGIWSGGIWIWALKKVRTLNEWYSTGKMAILYLTGVNCSACNWVR